MSGAPRPGFRLLAITPPAGPVDVGVVRAWEAAQSVGLTVLLREPGTAPAELLSEGHRLAPLRQACAEAGVRCSLSVDPAMVEQLPPPERAAGVAGVQLRGDPTAPVLERARRRLPEGWVLGRSCHGAPAAMGERVDYSVLAPIFTPRTASPQPGPGKRAVGLEPLRAFAAVERRVFALGGVGPDNAGACVEAGAYGLAAIRTFFGPPSRVAEDVAGLVAALAGPAAHVSPSR